jgi:hypothetical protein
VRPSQEIAVKRTGSTVLALFAITLCASARAQDNVAVRVDTRAPGIAIPADFAGISVEITNLQPEKNGKRIFSADNLPLIALFRTIGIRNLRVGGATADDAKYPLPSIADIDALFAFAKAAHVRVIYTLRLLNGSVSDDAKAAAYIEQHYASQLSCFQIGNEPDWHSFHTAPDHPRDPRIVEDTPNDPGSAWPSFLADWNTFAAAVVAAAPHARYTGPDTGSNYPLPDTKDTDFHGDSWTQLFAEAEKPTGRLAFVAQHEYVGEGATGVSVPAAIDSMLSREWVSVRYPALFAHIFAPVQAMGLTYRMTEANDYTGGVDGASNAFASALWALDYLHWHAAHGAAGINFHNKRWILTDTVYETPAGEFRFNPKAYGIKAFDIGSRGQSLPVAITETDPTNLTAYAVRDGNTVLVTLINKMHGPAAHTAHVTLTGERLASRAEALSLLAPANDPSAREGITLGGASINGEGWQGEWTPLSSVAKNSITIDVPPASAVIVRIPLAAQR